MPLVHGFDPISDHDSHVLVLGTKPGPQSLRVGQYYASNRNQFWPIVGRILDFDPALGYPERVARIIAAGLALWDVLLECECEGALDSEIKAPRPNDFTKFFVTHPKITQVYFNGTKAKKLYDQLVKPAPTTQTLTYGCLPSTSSANAKLTADEKLAGWRSIRP
jgi:TDG/mug DNA glycosylase family protein